MKIILSGYGRMGKEVEQIAHDRGHQVVARINTAEEWTALQYPKNEQLVVIDFSQTDAVLGVYRYCFDNQMPVVSGTTGWLNHWDEVIEECRVKEGTFFYASNFSLGVNIFFYLNQRLAQIMSKVSGYIPSVSETHHKYKIDAPSGTAITIANQIVKEITGIESWSLDKKSEASVLEVNSYRQGEVPGTHVVKYESNEDIILLEHQAKSRRGFAVGAVLAAEFVVGRKGHFSMQDLVGEIIA
ncbi:MAG: 4-hydroxy-tetrahydrodipicolinate reductase [Bacteroidetes bacterium]|nr:4-hydroxy-tetrahydrodipicolinate reductase [Bacteroidota bacterium]